MNCRSNFPPKKNRSGALTLPVALLCGVFLVTDWCRAGGQRGGDCNQDGAIDMSDGLCFLDYLFMGTPAELPCGDGSGFHPANVLLLDMDGDGSLTMSDAIRVLYFVFVDGPPHPFGDDCVEIYGCNNLCDAVPSACGDPDHLRSPPRAVSGPGNSVHVFAPNWSNELVHYYWSAQNGWSAENLTELVDPEPADPTYPMHTAPAVVVGPGQSQHVFSLNLSAELIQFHWAPSPGWAAEKICP